MTHAACVTVRAKNGTSTRLDADRGANRDATPTLAHRLRILAARVERLAVSGRTTPETVLEEKQQISRALRRLASEVP